MRYVLLGMLVMLAGCGDPGPYESNKSHAATACKTFVERRLKSPSTARIPAGTLWMGKDSIGFARFRISGYADAQNSFGAMLRSNFTCDVRYDTSAKEWRLNSLDMR